MPRVLVACVLPPIRGARWLPSKTPAADLQICHEIRHQVFVVEQGVPLELEIDSLEPVCMHLLLRCGGRPVGTARLHVSSDDTRGGVPLAKAERVAVLAAARGKGVGRLLMGALEDLARSRGASHLGLHAQIDATHFYHRLGYEVVGDVFMDAGIEHIAMRRSFEARKGSPGLKT